MIATPKTSFTKTPFASGRFVAHKALNLNLDTTTPIHKKYKKLDKKSTTTLSRTHKHINTKLVYDAILNHWASSLCYFIILKTKFKNQRIYNYSPKIIAKLLGISYNTAKFHIDILIKKQLIKKVKGKNGCTLILKRIADKKNRHNAYIKVGKNKQEQFDFLRYFIFQQKITKQNKEILRKLQIILKTSLTGNTKHLKKILRTSEDDRKKCEVSYTPYNTLSNATIALLYSRSISTAQRLTKRFLKLNLLIKNAIYIEVAHNQTELMFKLYRKSNPNSFYHKETGKIFRQATNEYIILNADRQTLDPLSKFTKLYVFPNKEYTDKLKKSTAKKNQSTKSAKKMLGLVEGKVVVHKLKKTL